MIESLWYKYESIQNTGSGSRSRSSKQKIAPYMGIERRSVTSGYHGSKISGSQQSFFTETSCETAICIVDRRKKSTTFCSRVQSCTGKSYISIFSFFFVPYLQDHGLLRSRNFASMARWRKDFCTLPETVLDSGFHAVVSRFQVRDSWIFFVRGTCIPDSNR